MANNFFGMCGGVIGHCVVTGERESAVAFAVLALFGIAVRALLAERWK